MVYINNIAIYNKEVCMNTLYINGKIASLDSHNNFYEAIGINRNTIDFLGSLEEATTKRNTYDQVIDLEGKLMLPGFNDSHLHLLNYGYAMENIDLSTLPSINDMVNYCRDSLTTSPVDPNNWLISRGWNQDTVSEKRFPTRRDLDKISTEIPILFTRVCGHIGICNSKAISLLNHTILETVNSNIDEETGTFQEDALFILLSSIPTPDLKNIKRMIRNSCRNLIANGITSVQSDDLKALPDQDYKKVIKAYKELREEGNLPVRVYEQCLFINQDEFQTFVNDGFRTGQGDDFFKIGPLKLLLDGSLGARTALLREDYNDLPGTVGVGCFKQNELNSFVEFAQKMGFQIAAHAIGDKAMDMILDSIENVKPTQVRDDDRHGIVHCQITDMDIIERMKANNVLGYIQPIFLDTDLHIVEKRVGKRCLETYAFKTMVDQGVKLCMSTDAPIVDINPFENIYSAVVRKDLKDMPNTPFMPHERLTVTEALKSYTINSAYASFEEKIKGTLEIGKMADMVVLDRDIFTIDEKDIKNIGVEMTIVDGFLYQF